MACRAVEVLFAACAHLAMAPAFAPDPPILWRRLVESFLFDFGRTMYAKVRSQPLPTASTRGYPLIWL